MSKTILTTPVFYKENANSPLLQLLNFSPVSGLIDAHDVVRGCGAAQIHIDDINKDNVSFNIARFNRVQTEEEKQLEPIHHYNTLKYLLNNGLHALLHPNPLVARVKLKEETNISYGEAVTA